MASQEALKVSQIHINVYTINKVVQVAAIQINTMVLTDMKYMLD